MSSVPPLSTRARRSAGPSIGTSPKSLALLLLLASVITWAVAIETAPLGAFLSGILTPSVATARLPSSVGGLAAVVGPLGITFPCWAARHHATAALPSAPSNGANRLPQA